MTKALAQQVVERLQGLVGDSQPQPGFAFQSSLAAAVLRRGESVRATAECWGVHHRVLEDALNGKRRPSERTVRQLAPFLDLTPDAAATMAGYANAAASADPRQFTTVRPWLEATLELRHESIRHFTLGAGVSDTSLHGILKRDAWVTRPTLDRIADYVGLERAELRALRPKNPRQVAHSVKVAADMELEQPGRMRELSARGRAGIRRYGADRVDGGKTAAIAALRRRSPEHWGLFLAAGIEVAERRRTRRQVLCVICGDPQRSLTQKPSQAHRGDGQQRHHHDCFHEWLRSSKTRELYSSLTLIWTLVRESGSKTQKDRIRAQLRAERNYLRQLGHRRGKAPSLLDDVALANEVAVLHFDAGLSTIEIQSRFGWSSRRDVRGNKSTGRQVQEVLALGRLLRCPWPPVVTNG